MEATSQFTQSIGPTGGSRSLPDSRGNERHISPIWQAAIDKYYEELRKGGVKGPTIDEDLWSVHSLNDLLQKIHSLAPTDSQASGNWVRLLRRLEPVLLSIDDFAAVATLALGMNGQAAAIIWGSIRLILKVCQFGSLGL
jgi:fungal STAND N-terminal Goodbye domain